MSTITHFISNSDTQYQVKAADPGVLSPIFTSDQLIPIGEDVAKGEAYYALSHSDSQGTPPLADGRLRIGLYKKVIGNDGNGTPVVRYSTSIQQKVNQAEMAGDPDFIDQATFTVAFTSIGAPVPTHATGRASIITHLLRLVNLLWIDPVTGTPDYEMLRRLTYGAPSIKGAGSLSSVTAEIATTTGELVDVV